VDRAAAEDGAGAREELLPYVAGRLDAWPDAARQCPRPRLLAYESGEPIWCTLVRALDYEGQSMGKKRVAALLDAPGFADVTRLDLRSAKMKWELLGEFVEKAPCRLEHFGFRRVSKMDWGVVDAMIASPMLSELSSLTFRGWDKIKPDIYDHMIELLPMDGIRHLDLSGGAITAKRLKSLLATGKLDGLRSLDVGGWVSEKKTTGVIAEVAKRAELDGLESLRVRDHKPKELAALASAEHLSGLKRLHLAEVTAAELELILSSEHLTSLESLRLFASDEEVEGVLRVLTASERTANLRELFVEAYVDDHPVPVDTFRAFFESPHLANVERLGFDADDVHAFEAFAGATGLVGLKQLVWGSLSAQVTPSTLRACFDAEHMMGVEGLVCRSWNDSSETVEALMGSAMVERGALRAIRPIDLDARAWVELVSHPSCARLKVLDLSDAGHMIARRVVPVLGASPHVSGLEAVIMDTHYRVDELVEWRMTHADEDHLPEVLHIAHPEYAYLQQFDWFD